MPILLPSIAVLILIVCQWLIDTQHPDKYENQNFIYLTQPDDITCGPTSVAMLVQWYGKKVTIDDVTKLTKTRWLIYDGKNIGMTNQYYIESALNQLGVPSKLRRGSIDNLKHYISEGRPPIVLVRSGGIAWHYVVVIGFTEEKIIVADPGDGERLEMSLKDFLGSWQFTHDMEGNPCGIECPLCKGKKRYNNWLPGNCDLCWGTGLVDPLRHLFEPYSQTMVVPKNKRD